MDALLSISLSVTPNPYRSETRQRLLFWVGSLTWGLTIFVLLTHQSGTKIKMGLALIIMYLGLENVFYSFLSKTKQDQALPRHSMGKYGPIALNFGYDFFIGTIFRDTM